MYTKYLKSSFYNMSFIYGQSTYQSPRPVSCLLILDEKILKVFVPYGHGTRTIRTNFHSPTQRSPHMKFEFDWPSGVREDV